MGIQATKIGGELHEFVWVRNGDSCRIEYLAGTLTGDDMKAKLAEVSVARNGDNAAAQQQMIDQTLEMLDEILVSWEVLDDDGSMWPTDVAGLGRLPFSFCMEVLQACQKDMVDGVGEADANSSGP